MAWEWLKHWWEDPAKQSVAGYLAGKEDDCSTSAAIKPRAQYFSVAVECMRIVLEREGPRKFFGAVTGRIGFNSTDGPDAITLVISPEALKGVDRGDLGRIVVQSVPLCEKLPYIGECLDLRLALMSLQGEDLLVGIVDVLSSVAKAAGIGFVEQAKAFLAPIENGIALLSRQGGTEIGIYKVITEPRTGYYCVARAPSTRLDLAKSKLSANWELMDQNGRLVSDIPYLILRIAAHDKKENFASIPSIRSAYERMRKSALEGKEKEAREAFEFFRRTVIWSDDLLDHDRRPMVEWARKNLEDTFPAKEERKRTVGVVGKSRAFPKLETLRL